MAGLQVCVLVLVCASGTAAAQHARYPRQQPAPSTPVLSERVKPLVAKPADPAATQPSIDADGVLSIEGLRGPVRAETERILADLITNTPDSEAEEKMQPRCSTSSWSITKSTHARSSPQISCSIR